ncbi:MAG: hypothetical protein HYU66_23230 [Armatimonadetes bacterium]|nr:hypothetical protein [Armatimonadota bacterium]
MKVVVVCEDPQLDQYTLQPLVAAMMARLGRPRANVEIDRRERCRGYHQALDRDRLARVVDRHKHADLFLVVVDRDGDATRRGWLDEVERYARDVLRLDQHLLAENAHQEVEVWILAGMTDLPSGWAWQDVRSEPDSKARYFEPYVAQRGLSGGVGRGRQALAREAAGRYASILRRCPEDIGSLHHRIAAWLNHP